MFAVPSWEMALTASCPSPAMDSGMITFSHGMSVVSRGRSAYAKAGRRSFSVPATGGRSTALRAVRSYERGMRMTDQVTSR